MGKIFFYQLKTAKKGEKRREMALEVQFFFKKGYKGYQSTAKVKGYSNPGSFGH